MKEFTVYFTYRMASCKILTIQNSILHRPWNKEHFKEEESDTMIKELYDEKHFLEKTKLNAMEFIIFQERRPEYGTLLIINGEKKLFFTKIDVNFAQMLKRVIQRDGSDTLDYEKYFRIKDIFIGVKQKGMTSYDDVIKRLNDVMRDYDEPITIALVCDNPEHDTVKNLFRVKMEIKFDASYPEKSEDEKILFLQRVRKIVNVVSFAYGKVFQQHRPHYFDLTREDVERAWRKQVQEGIQ